MALIDGRYRGPHENEVLAQFLQQRSAMKQQEEARKQQELAQKYQILYQKDPALANQWAQQVGIGGQEQLPVPPISEAQRLDQQSQTRFAQMLNDIANLSPEEMAALPPQQKNIIQIAQLSKALGVDPDKLLTSEHLLGAGATASMPGEHQVAAIQTADDRLVGAERVAQEEGSTLRNQQTVAGGIREAEIRAGADRDVANIQEKGKDRREKPAGARGRDDTGNLTYIIGKAIDGKNLIDEIKPKVGFFTTGIVGALPGLIPGTPQHGLARNLETLEGIVAFDTLQEMREASPTGGALGQVSEREIDLLASVRGNLSRLQSSEQLATELDRVRGAFERMQTASTMKMQGASDDEILATIYPKEFGGGQRQSSGSGKTYLDNNGNPIR